MGKNYDFWLILKVLLFLFFFGFFLYPLILILGKAFAAGPVVWNTVLSLIFSGKHLLWNSFIQASVSTFFAVLIGIPVAFVLARRDFPGKQAIKSIFLIPFVFPSILVVISFVIVFGNNGWFNTILKNVFLIPEPISFLYGFTGIVLAHVFYNFPIVAKFVSTSWEQIDVSMKEAAQTLGANKIKTFFTVTLPQLIPSILASASLVFIFSFMSFVIVLTFGGVKFTTFEVEIFHQIVQNLNIEVGALLALFQFLILALVVYLYLWLSKKYTIQVPHHFDQPKKLSLRFKQGLLEVFVLISALVFVALPIISLILFAFIDPQTQRFSLQAFEKIFFSETKSLAGTTALTAVLFSLGFAIIAAFTATVIALLASLKQTRIPGVDLLLSSSLAISLITLGFGYLLGFGSGLFWLIAIGHAVLTFPFAHRVIYHSLVKIDQSSLDAAITLGASKWMLFRTVIFPRIKYALLVAVVFAFAISLGELGFVLMLYDGIYATMPVYIYRLLSTFDLFAAAAMGVLLIAISFLCFYMIERLSKKEKVVW